MPCREKGHPYLKRSEHLPQQIKDIGRKAQTRLCKRYRHLSRMGKPQPRVIAAIARELADLFGTSLGKRLSPPKVCATDSLCRTLEMSANDR
jgi:hypothetical protein